jgi:hypothetical protein
VKPAIGRLYAWDDVRDDFYFKLPELSSAGLAQYAGLPSTFKISGSIGPTQGFVALGSDEDREGAERGGVPLRLVPKSWDRARDRDTRLNNLLDWNREAVAVYPFGTGDARTPQRHLLVLRPEALAAYFTCLRESPDAAARYRDRPVRDRVLGYVRVGEQKDDEGVRVLIVAETCLPTPLPADEEDLLTPGPKQSDKVAR